METEVLKGKTLTRFEADLEKNEIFIETTTGEKFRYLHFQDCCESVTIEDIIGDTKDLIGTPITMAEEIISNEYPEGVEKPEYTESFTWTFYKFATVKGYVTIRWFGESNGYYSESVELIKDE